MYVQNAVSVGVHVHPFITNVSSTLLYLSLVRHWALCGKINIYMVTGVQTLSPFLTNCLFDSVGPLCLFDSVGPFGCWANVSAVHVRHWALCGKINLWLQWYTCSHPFWQLCLLYLSDTELCEGRGLWCTLITEGDLQVMTGETRVVTLTAHNVREAMVKIKDACMFVSSVCLFLSLSPWYHLPDF